MSSYFKITILISILLILLGDNNSFSQKKCGTVEFNKQLKKKFKYDESIEMFEQWINEKRNLRSSSSKTTLKKPEVYRIPVVIHVIHNGEALNTEGNISDEQIFAQLDSLNKDFRRLNADTIETLSQFQSLASDAGIEFVLAKRDPEGLPTTGIIRKQGLRSTYSQSNDAELKAQSYWPAEDYLNIWITDLNSGFLGYAQFPTSNLEGLDRDQSISRLTDGVVLDWRFTGTNFNTGAFASLGRTATHEMGHFLGLRHIWGDGGCSIDDYCPDTPTQGSSSTGCPTVGKSTCGSEDMFQNFMDFSDDVCMNLFTQCQADRMRIIMENSPRRKSLLTSMGTMDPVFVDNDLGIREIISPINGECSGEITPQLEVKNYGSNAINSFTIELYVDGNFTESISKSVTLSQLATNLVSFSTLTGLSQSTSTFRFEIVSTNSIVDGNKENNMRSVVVNFPNEVVVPYLENFELGLNDWSLINSHNDNSSMTLSLAPNIELDNIGFRFGYFQNSNAKFGELDWLISPVLDFSALPSVDMRFKYSYAPISGSVFDVLTIGVSTDCGYTFEEQDYVFQEFSPALGTTSTVTESFVPQGPSDWRELTINLADYAGNSSVVIAFIGHNGNGSNLYIDDFELVSDNILAFNLGITEVKSIPISSCLDDIFPTVEVKNFGFETISSFDLTYTLGSNSQTINTNGLSLLPGKTQPIFIPISDIELGEHQIQFEVLNPNGQPDEQSSNNVVSHNFIINDTNDIIPIREDFDKSIEESAWDIIRADEVQNLSIMTTSGNGFNNQSLVLNSYSLPGFGVENWLVSPNLDLTETDSASMAFKVSYANIIGRNDKLEVKVSTNCGLNYTHTIYSKKGAALAVTETISEWFPETKEDWVTEFLDLSEFIVWPEITIAFVFTSQNGNNIFLDDVEIFNQGSPTIRNFEKNQITIFPAPASASFKAKFNLNIKDDLVVTLTDIAGNIVLRSEIPNMLNQELETNITSLKNGIYILHATGKNTNLSKKVIIEN